jgi:hypothetical protein
LWYKIAGILANNHQSPPSPVIFTFYTDKNSCFSENLVIIYRKDFFEYPCGK